MALVRLTGVLVVVFCRDYKYRRNMDKDDLGFQRYFFSTYAKKHTHIHTTLAKVFLRLDW